MFEHVEDVDDLENTGYRINRIGLEGFGRESMHSSSIKLRGTNDTDFVSEKTNICMLVSFINGYLIIGS